MNATSTARRLQAGAELEALVFLLCQLRPNWDAFQVRTVLLSHAHTVHVADLEIAAIRYAADPKYDTPKGIGWRGPHWIGLSTQPDHVARSQGARCGTCGKPEDRCIIERPGPDDHPYDPVPDTRARSA